MTRVPEGGCRVAIAGASSLRGKELKQVLEDRNFPATDFVLLDEVAVAGTLTEAGGEPSFIRAIAEDSFEGVRFAFFAGSPESAARDWLTARRAGATVIDLSGGLAQEAGTFPWIPALSKLLPPPPPASKNGAPGTAPYSSPATAVLIACSLVAGLQQFSPVRLAVTFYPPVSELDQDGVDELEAQATSLLSFRPITQAVFDAQTAFNLLSAFGPGSRANLAGVRAAIAKGIAQYVDGRTPVPAVQIVQTPTFYGYAFSCYAEFPSAPDRSAVEAALASAGMQVAAAGSPPSNVSAAGENRIQLARVEHDANVSSALWLWGVADNLRLSASNAVQIAEELLVIPV
jgi:aspartate-semialdehyde dehydrogenase